jgi:hypothetical protein
VWWRTFDAWLDAEMSRNTTTQMDHALIGPRPVKLVNVKRNRLAVSGITTTRFIPNAVVRILRVQGVVAAPSAHSARRQPSTPERLSLLLDLTSCRCWTLKQLGLSNLKE